MKSMIQKIMFLLLPASFVGQSGNLDITFDGDGKKVVSFAVPNEYGEFPLTQPDGKIIVVGRSSLSGGYLSFSLARLRNNGTFDPTFGTSGKVTTSYGTEGFEAKTGLLQPDGKIIVAGDSYTNASLGYSQVVVVRYNTDGTLDTTFDSDGMTFTQVPTSNEDFSKSVVLQPDGKIVVGVQTRTNANFDFVLIRYNPDGSLDSSFGLNGIARNNLSATNEAIYDIALLPSGKIIAVGYKSGTSNDDVYAVQYNADGSIDTTFGVNGAFNYDFASNHNYAFAVAVDSNNKIVIGGRYTGASYSSPFVLRLLPNGTFDNSFNGTGIKIETTNETYDDVVLQSDDKILLIGTSNTKFGVTKLNQDGSFDISFGTSGKVETLVATNYCLGKKGALQTDGKLVVVGDTYGNPFMKMGVVRYTNDAPLSNASFAFLNNSFSVFPNPSSGHFTIKAANEIKGENIIIYNVMGQEEKKVNLDNNDVAVLLNKGMYFLQLEKEGKKTNEILKIIINE